jgi:hypothetical protein
VSAIRDRAKEHFPMVLLTLLSIVQALALELLWSHVLDAEFLYAMSWDALIVWTQIVATFIGLILIWVVYAANAMRFRWVPLTVDSVYPFIIGVLEFTLIETLDPGRPGQWLMLNSVIFGSMVFVTHHLMRRARFDGDNDVFFRNYSPATARDFLPHFIIVGLMVAAGAYIWLARPGYMFTLLSLLGTLGVLSWQFYQTAVFWKRTMVVESGDSEKQDHRLD